MNLSFPYTNNYKENIAFFKRTKLTNDNISILDLPETEYVTLYGTDYPYINSFGLVIYKHLSSEEIKERRKAKWKQDYEDNEFLY